MVGDLSIARVAAVVAGEIGRVCIASTMPIARGIAEKIRGIATIRIVGLTGTAREHAGQKYGKQQYRDFIQATPTSIMMPTVMIPAAIAVTVVVVAMIVVAAMITAIGNDATAQGDRHQGGSEDSSDGLHVTDLICVCSIG